MNEVSLVAFIYLIILIVFLVNTRNRGIGRATDSHTSSSPESSLDLQTHEPANAYTHNVRFQNLVLYSGYNTRFTEIDEVIVSPYGIFCIEYKADVGIILGREKQEYWKQCRFDKRVSKYNPILQNYKHVKSLETLLGNNLKAPIHSIVVYTNAHKLNVDSSNVLLGTQELNTVLKKHNSTVYSTKEWGKIAKILTLASTMKNSRMDTHIKELNEYLTAKATS